MLQLREPAHVLSHRGIDSGDMYVARCYILFSCIVAFVCSAWSLDNYMNGSTTMRAYSWIGTISSAMLVTGLLLEWVVYRNGGCCGRSGGATRVAETLRTHGVGISLVHVATSSISTFSTCASAVNIYNNSSAGLYAISCSVLAVNWIYYVMYTPSTVMHLAIFSNLSEAQQILIAFQQQSTQYVWRNSKIDPSQLTG
jgi:hypothetical protein